MVKDTHPNTYTGNPMPVPCVENSASCVELDPLDVSYILVAFATSCRTAIEIAHGLRAYDIEFLYRQVASNADELAGIIEAAMAAGIEYNRRLEEDTHGRNN